MARYLSCLFLGALLSAVVGCESPKVDIVATTGMIADAAKRIGGDQVRVACLMGPGVDPHRFQPSAGDLGKLDSARLVLYNGLHLEGKMSDVFEHSLGAKAVAVTKDLDRHRDLRAVGIKGLDYDPHVWFDVRLWITCVKTTRDAMIAKFPEHESVFRANAEQYLSELINLEAEVREKVARLPPERRILITGHDAFGYFARAYGFTVHGLQGVSTDAESSMMDATRLAEIIGQQKVLAIFTETSVPSQGLEQVLDIVRRKYKHEVKLIGDADALFSDALGEAGTPGGTYIGMVRHNIDVITRSLAGQ
jgi:manganese/zinc/iron transport system substrate-binding protein